MPVELINPSALPVVPLYHQLSVATGSRVVHVAGQVAVDADGQLVGLGDLAAQVEQCLLNVSAALSADGADLSCLTELTAYFVGVEETTASAYELGMQRASARIDAPIPRVPFTGVGVVALAGPELLVEIKATAMID